MRRGDSMETQDGNARRDGRAPTGRAARPAGDGPSAVVTSGGKAAKDGLGWPLYAVVAAAVLATGLVNALSAAHDLARNGGAYRLGQPLIWELSSTIVIAALVPAVANAIRRLRMTWQRREWWRFGLLAIATVVTFSAAHIVGMVLLRQIAVAIYGAAYHFDWSPSELAYEFRKDATTCVLFGIVFWLALSRRDGIVARETAASVDRGGTANVPDRLWLRDGATSIRVIPSEVLWLSSAGNYVEYRLADGTTHLIRATLAKEEPRLEPFGIVRVHRTKMVNLHRVVSVVPRASGDFELWLDTNETLTGSRRYRDAIAGLAADAENAAAARQTP